MSLRRLAQNNAASASPRVSLPAMSSGSPASSAASSGPSSTPRNRPRRSLAVYQSPVSSPSRSASIPFDWEAARSLRAPPFATPPRKPRNSFGGQSTPGTPARKAFIRKKGLWEKITSFPSEIAFQIALFPNNIPLPAPRTSAWIIGGLLHFVHLCVRIGQLSDVPDANIGWEDMYREDQGQPWFDWTIPMTVILISASFVTALYLFTRIRIYRLHLQPEPVSSPNAKFVPAIEPFETPSMSSRLRVGLWQLLIAFWRFLLGLKSTSSSSTKKRQVQQLEVWTPGELELTLFCVYSPAHAFLWMATSTLNWMIMPFVMIIVSVQLHVMTLSYKLLLKDKEIIAAEVMHEYNEGFVYPRVHPVRKDASIMTHQSEVVNIWED